MKSLLVGCGQNNKRRVALDGVMEWGGELVTLDINPNCRPDITTDLERLPYAWAATNEYDEIHAYEVLEHTGYQGDYHFFFAQFSEFWRILKPAGLLCATVPAHGSIWMWGDPSHRRVINEGSLVFLDQTEYQKQSGATAMSDFRHIYSADFELVQTERSSEHGFTFVLRAHKPPRSS